MKLNRAGQDNGAEDMKLPFWVFLQTRYAGKE